MGRYVVYDCDVGNDDAWGLMMLIKAEEAYKRRQDLMLSPKKFEIIGVTCVQGNTTVDYAVVNTLRVLDAVNRNDVSATMLPCNLSICIETNLAMLRYRFIKGAVIC